MQLSPVHLSFESLTPRKLLSEFKQGKRPEYKHENDDLNKELEILAQKYKQTMDLQDKSKLIAHEKKVLLDGLKNPEMTLARNYKNVSKFIRPDNKDIVVEDALRLFDATGLNRLVGLSGAFKTTGCENDVEVIKQAYFEIDENSLIGERAKKYLIIALNKLQFQEPKLKNVVNNTLIDMLDKTTNQNLIDEINSILEIQDVNILLNDLQLNPNQENNLRFLLLKTKANSNNEITSLLTSILSDKNVSQDVYEVALLGAGKFRSDDNFSILKSVALDKNIKDVRNREFALQSIALYIKEKPEDVKNILSKVEQEKSIYGSLAKILNDKVNGNYHNQNNRELRYVKMSKKQIERFNKNKSKFLLAEDSLNKKQQNACDRFILPFKKILGQFVNDDYKFLVQADTFTKQNPELAGSRYFEDGAGILNSGDFYDVFDGINSSNYSMMNKYRVSPASHSNQTGHELGHALNRMFDETDMKTIVRLYKNAIKNGKALDYYAAANYREYFAQGCDAFISTYKPHKDLLHNHPIAHTKFELLKKDPDLYKFIKKCFKKYH